MMFTFLANNREELIERCKAKVAKRPTRGATDAQLAHGIPIFLGQLERTLQAEELGHNAESLRISGAPGGDENPGSEMSVTAIAHGRELLELGFSIEQVVHDYGDLCQSITDLAVERDAPFGVPEFRTLNRCLDNAIAGAVAEFSAQRDVSLARSFNERLGFLVHELSNSLLTASLAIAALDQGNLPLSGATGSVLKRSIRTMKNLIKAAVNDVREVSGIGVRTFRLAEFVAEAAETGQLYAEEKGAQFRVEDVEMGVELAGNRGLLIAALGNPAAQRVQVHPAGDARDARGPSWSVTTWTSASRTTAGACPWAPAKRCSSPSRRKPPTGPGSGWVSRSPSEASRPTAAGWAFATCRAWVACSP
jgi:hypothetical protein